MSTMPWWMYLPKIQSFFNKKVWQLTIFRDYGIEIDFKKGNLIDWLRP
jgi:hypothetical protein